MQDKSFIINTQHMFVDHDNVSELFSDFLDGITRASSEFFCRMFKEIIQKCACTWSMSLTCYN